MEILPIKHTFLTKVPHYSDQLHHYLFSFILPRTREVGKWYCEWWHIIFSQTHLSPTKISQSKASNIVQQMGASLLTSMEKVTQLETGEACRDTSSTKWMGMNGTYPEMNGEGTQEFLAPIEKFAQHTMLDWNDTCMHYLRALLVNYVSLKISGWHHGPKPILLLPMGWTQVKAGLFVLSHQVTFI